MYLRLPSDRRSVTLFALLFLVRFSESFNFNGLRFVSRPSVSSNNTPRLAPLSAQSLDYTSLYLSVQELAKVSVPGKVENIVQENEYNIFFGIKTDTGNNVWLQFCWHPTAARIGLGYAPPKGETIPYSFAATLRALLRGYSVTKIHIPTAFDRIAEVEFSERLSDEKPKWRLILEVMGARSNAILVSHDDNVIQACAYQVSSATTVRPLQTGGTYYQPPSGGGIFSPSYKEGIDGEDFLSIFTSRLQELDVTVEKSLISCYRGMSPNIARRILNASNVDGSSMVKTLNSKDILNIFRYFCAWASIFDSSIIQRMHSAEYSLPALVINPGLIEFGTKKIQEFYPITFNDDDIKKSSSVDVLKDSLLLDANVEMGVKDAGVNINTSLQVSKFLLSFYSLYERKAAFQLLRASCDRKVSLRIKKAGKVLAEFQEQEKDAKGEKCEDLMALGDLITSFTHSYKEKSQVLQCYDFITGEPKSIAIPVGVTPSDFAKNAYMKAKKLKRSLKVLGNLIAKVTLHVDYLNEIEASLSGLMDYISYEDITTLTEIEEELEDLEQLTIIQLGDSSSSGELPAIEEKLSTKDNKDKDKKKSKSKLKSGKQTKSTAKIVPTAKKGSTNTSPTSQKKALQGLLVLRPPSASFSNSNSNSNSNSRSTGNDAEVNKKSSKNDRSDSADSDLSPPLPSLIVGRSSKQNDRITFVIAKEHHLWFHVQGVPGSHVLLKLEPGDQPSPEGIQYAADVASFYSKARGGTKVPVGYCSPKHIRRITGGSPGMVSIMQQGGMVYGSPEKGKMWVEKYGPQTIDSYK